MNENYNYDSGFWKKSASHIAFLGIYKKIRKKGDKISSYSFQKIASIDKECKQFFKYLVDNGYIVTPNLRLSLVPLFNTDELKALLKERGLPHSGLKITLIDRLIADDEQSMRDVAQIDKLLVCSEKSIETIADFENYKHDEVKESQNICYELLLKCEYRKAYKIYIDLLNKYDCSNTKPDTYVLKNLQYTLNANPESLKYICSEDMKIIKSCKCMEIIWGKHCESGVDTTKFWIDKTMDANKYKYDIVLNHLSVNIKLKYKVDRLYGDMLKIKLDENQMQSCVLCAKYDGAIIKKMDIPQFPINGCDSIYECGIDIESYFEKTEDDDIDDETIELQSTNNPVQTLRMLKEMLDDGLITQDDYDKKKNILLDIM